MPLYDYKCSACGAVHEHRQKISDEPLRECPDCGGEYKRIITSVGVIFKGSGFHINDYRDNKSGGASDASTTKEASPAQSATSTTPSGTESKTEKAADSGSSSSDQGKSVA